MQIRLSSPLLFLSAAAALLAGCATSATSILPSAPGASPSVTSQGRVFGGQQPVTGAVVQLYSVGTSGLASAATPLLTSTVTTSDGSGSGGNAGNNFNRLPAGNFIITGLYSCSAATQVYITATGGNAGAGSNSAIALAAALGPCSSLSSSTFININELTTAAAAWSLAPFMSSFTRVGASGSNPTGLVNAFSMAASLVSFSTGLPPAPPTGVTLPTARLNTIGNILASCVNAASPSAPSCSSLLAATGASDTIGAALAMAKNPGSSAITGLFSLAGGYPQFYPALSAQPSDFTLSININGSALATPAGIAIDSSGAAWVTNESGFTLAKLPAMSASFTAFSYSNPYLLSPRGISIDRSGNVWVANTGGNSVLEFTSAGASITGSGFTTGGISTPVAIANDSAGNAWVVNFAGNSITELTASGAPTSASPITGSGALSVPTAIALDSAGRVAVANSATGQLCLFSSAAVLQSCVGDGFLLGATGIAVNSSGLVAMSGTTTGASLTGAATFATSTGSVNANSPVFGGGLALPAAVAYDSAGVAWFANASSISAFSGTTALSPASGYGSLNSPAAIAIDPSGNIWTANSGDSSVSVFVGLAAPTATPISLSVGP